MAKMPGLAEGNREVNAFFVPPVLISADIMICQSGVSRLWRFEKVNWV